MGAVYLYRFNFFTGFIVSSSVYWLLCRVKPVPATSRVWCEKPEDTDRQFSVVYTEGEPYDEERSNGALGRSSDNSPAMRGAYPARDRAEKSVYLDNKAQDARF